MHRRNLPITLLIVPLLLSTFLGCVSSPPVKGPDEEKAPEEELSPEEEALENLDTYLSRGNTEKALEEMARYREAAPSKEADLAYINMLLNAGKLDEAEENLIRFLEEDPENSGGLFTQALLHGAQGRPEEQKKSLDKLLTRTPDHSAGLALSGELSLMEKDYETAKELFQAAVEADAENQLALAGMGTVSLRNKAYEKALEYYDRAVAISPQDPLLRADRSLARKALGDIQGAEEDLNKAVELDPDSYWHYLDRGRLRLRHTGDKKGALEDFNSAIAIWPEYFYAYIFRAGILDEMDRYEEAIADYRKVLADRPDYYFAYTSLGVLQYMTGDYRGCKTSMLKAFEAQPRDFSPLLLAGLAARRSQEGRGLEQFIDEIMGLVPHNSLNYHVLRSFKEPEYTDLALRYVQEEENKTVQNRMLFYLASNYMLEEAASVAVSYFTYICESDLAGLYECRLARNELAQQGIKE